MITEPGPESLAASRGLWGTLWEVESLLGLEWAIGTGVKAQWSRGIPVGMSLTARGTGNILSEEHSGCQAKGVADTPGK